MRTEIKLIALAAAVTLAACGKKEEAQAPGAAPAAEQLVVKIGNVGPTSGQVAHFGQDTENGARMAVNELNARGLTIGGKRARFVLMAEDDGGDPKQGTAVAQKLVDAGVAGVVGHLNSGTTVPASKIYHSAGIPQITPSATTPRPRLPATQPRTRSSKTAASSAPLAKSSLG